MNICNLHPILVLFILIVISSFYFDFISQHRYHKKLKDREFLSVDNIYDRYYSNTEIDRKFLEEILPVIEKGLGVKYGLLRPDDRIDEDLSVKTPFKLESDSEYLFDFTIRILHDKHDEDFFLSDELNQFINDLSDVTTVDDFIRKVYSIESRFT